MKNKFISQIRALLLKPEYQPLNKTELAKELRVKANQRAAFRDAMIELETTGELNRGKKSRYRLASRHRRAKLESFLGTISFSRDRKRQSAFFIPDDPQAHASFRVMDRPRVFVPGRAAGTALDGDRVEVNLVSDAPPTWHRNSTRHKGGEDTKEEWSAKVIRVIERNRTQIVGKFYSKGARATVVPEDGRLPTSFRLTEVLPEAKPGDVIVAEFIGWDSPLNLPTAAMIEVLGRETDPGVDILSVIHRYSLPLEFPPEALREADHIQEEVSPEEIERREDWREREVFTIDPYDAKDFDDAICVTENPDGTWELAVHIADVSHYVKPGSALDREARHRGNSVYLADRVLPMLPEKLSNGVCSLKPGVERLTHAAILTFDAKGKQTAARFAAAVIRSHGRFSYEEAIERMKLDEGAIAALSDEKERSLAVHLQRAWRLAAMLRDRRFANGALDLEFAEVKVVLDENGRAVGVKRSDYDESHQLIEEFMLAANEAVAYETKNAPAPSLYRVHEDPDPGKLQEFAEQARAFGHTVGDVSNRSELQKLLKNVKGTLEEHSLKIGLLKSLRRAAYSRDSIGHYGLAKTNYTHFTSPVRRYADLIVHRALRRILSRRQEPTAPIKADWTPSYEEMGAIAEHISRTERVAAEAEVDTQRLKMVEYLEHICDEDDETIFTATVFDVKPIGAFAELDDLMVKGMIRKDDLPPRDEYFFDRSKDEFRSRAGGPPISVGKRIQVRLYRVNRSRGFIDFVPVSENSYHAKFRKKKEG